MGLTVTEKQHWRDRIASRIDKKIDVIKSNEAALFERIKREARNRALVSLELADLQTQLDTADQEGKELARRRKQLAHAMIARVRGVSPEELDESAYHHQQEVRQAIAKRQSIHEEELLAPSDAGQQVLRLMAERENLLDTVWLSTCPSQIRQLWAKVMQLLGDPPTQLERDALSIEPTPAE